MTQAATGDWPAPADPSPSGTGRLPTHLLGRVLAITGGIGAAASLALLLDRIRLLGSPAFVPACSVGPVLTCAPIMTSPQAEVLGFPNPIIGVAAFPIVATLGVVVLAGSALPRWIWLGLHLGALAGTGFVHWLVVQSLYAIGALCPYCIGVWVVTITLFWYLTVHVVTARFLPIPAAWARTAARLAQYHTLVPTLWLLGIGVLVVARFWPYWTELLGG